MPAGMFIAGKWLADGEPLEVTNKYSGEILGAVPIASAQRIEQALASAEQAAETMANLPVHKRSAILAAVAAKLTERREDFARTIAAEAGKALKIARGEVDRAAVTFQLAAEEARRIHGETIELDAVPAGEGYFGFWRRRPIGVTAAITPFNFPLNLVAHKIAPALAAGNSIVLKPAEQTPLTAVKLFEVLEAAGVPEGGVGLLHGPGETVGDALVRDPRVRKVTFTGSREVGRIILSRAGIKKVTLELGNTSPVIVAPDVDLDFVAKRCAFGAFVYSGQVCISVQRIYGQKEIFAPLSERLVAASRALKIGDPLDENTDIGPMIHAREAERIEGWVKEAQSAGAKVLCGGRREGAVYHPTLLSGTRPEMKVVAQEVFAPVASVIEAPSFEDALAQANAGEYGLQAAVFTKDIDRVLHAIRKLDFGGVIVNDMPAFRADHMPYGGNRQSGLGREGLRFAIEEMTNIQLVAIKTAPV